MAEISARGQEILTILRHKRELSRSDLAKRMGITKSAITIIINEMTERGILLEQGEWRDETAAPSRGRRKRIISINSDYKLIFGVFVGKGEINIGLCNLRGDILDKRFLPIEAGEYRKMLEQIMDAVADIMKNNCISYERLLGIGVCSDYDFTGKSESGDLTQPLGLIKRELTHAAPVKICVCEGIEGALRAQRVFGGADDDALLVIESDDESRAAFGVGGAIYRGENRALLGLLSGDEAFKRIANAVSCFDLSTAYVFGADEASVEKFIYEAAVRTNGGAALTKSVCSGDRGFLAAAAIVAEQEFYCMK